ncbi:hypothetical protein AX774_g5272 [Zancudomyces culisetae]|uniref:Uncharacterized protein n=1 Tax=Zancudomyces culisetae TaxID=1213189 RepID=A0A1R1PJZ1_ZANCU|nr:hypothetical protein AX774_g5272 [Zancudomyces culisetae]|eukprot:OMH81274.1 hypothetical protein AX774_g5272 [Zancudomyces culisetae]
MTDGFPMLMANVFPRLTLALHALQCNSSPISRISASSLSLIPTDMSSAYADVLNSSPVVFKPLSMARRYTNKGL